jgi:hypothetical protein
MIGANRVAATAAPSTPQPDDLRGVARLAETRPSRSESIWRHARLEVLATLSDQAGRRPARDPPICASRCIPAPGSGYAHIRLFCGQLSWDAYR